MIYRTQDNLVPRETDRKEERSSLEKKMKEELINCVILKMEVNQELMRIKLRVRKENKVFVMDWRVNRQGW